MDKFFIDFFFFKLKTAYEIPLCDWSSDVCSSDLDRVSRDHGGADHLIHGVVPPDVLGVELKRRVVGQGGGVDSAGLVVARAAGEQLLEECPQVLRRGGLAP